MSRMYVVPACIVLGCSMVCGVSPQAVAQAEDFEFNDDCESVQDVRDVAPPMTISGTIAPPPDASDVDFFLLSATPGSVLVADLQGSSAGAGTLSDPLLGLFDTDCTLLLSNDDFNSLDSRLDFQVPANGQFIFAVTSCCDFGFDGVRDINGSYLLSVVPQAPPIGGISVRVIDAVSRLPVRGDAPPWATMQLLECDVNACNRVVTQLQPNSEGVVRFVNNFRGVPLPAGRYQVQAFANGYRESYSDPFDVDVSQQYDLGDIAIDPPLIAVSLLEGCTVLVPQGDECTYSTTIRNNSEQSLEGLAWSLVDAYSLGSTLDYATFEANVAGTQRSRQSVQLDALSSQDVQFTFEVPGFVRDGATFCTRLFFGLNPSPVMNTSRAGELFCLTKGEAAYRTLSKSETHKHLSRLTRHIRR